MNRQNNMYNPRKSGVYAVPETVDLRQKAKETKGSNRTIMVIALILVWVVISVLIMLKMMNKIYIRIPFFIGSLYLLMIIIRVAIYNEGEVSNNFEYLLENDFEIQPDIFWDIYDIREGPVPIVSYTNGLRGVFIRFEKDVVVGKGDHARFKHYDGISNMMNAAMRNGLITVTIDTMDAVANEVDMGPMYEFIENSDIAPLKGTLEQCYAFGRNLMEASYSKTDVMLFLTRGTIQELEAGYKAVQAAAEGANYHRSTLLGKDDIQSLAQSIFNLEHFSINNAIKETLTKIQSTIIRPIKVIDDNGVELETINNYTWDRSHLEDQDNNVKGTNKNNDDFLEIIDETGLDIFDEETNILDTKPKSRRRKNR